MKIADLVKKHFPAVGVIGVVVSVVTGTVIWAETRFADLRFNIQEMEERISLRIETSRANTVDKLDDSEELLITRMISTTNEVKQQQHHVVNMMNSLNYRLGVVHGLEISEEPYTEDNFQ